LRLYCIRVSESIVILFNGGQKTAQTAQKSPDLITEFYDAQVFAKKIEYAISRGKILIATDNRTLVNQKGDFKIIFNR
jgi:hypothetical protein